MSRAILVALGLPGIFLFSASLLQSGGPPASTLIVVLLIVLALVLLNGLFVAAEFAIIGVRPSRVEQLVDEGNLQARKVLEVLQSNEKQDQYIATAQVGITLASLGLGMYGEPRIAVFIEPVLERLAGGAISSTLLHSIAFIISLSIVTYLHVVIGEMVPKSRALADADKAVLWLIRPMNAAQALLSPAVHALNFVGNWLLLNVLRIPPAQGHQRLHSTEELELIVSESAEGGLLNEEEEEMILNIFDFSDRQVGQVMTPRRKAQAIAHDTPLDELMAFVSSSNYSRFPVYEGDLDHVIGILHLKDLVHQQLHTRGSLDIRLILRPAPSVPEYQPVDKLLAAFKRQRIHMAIVLDEFGGMAGIVTLEDLIEEVVGEVRDEFDVEREPFALLEPGVIEVAGNLLLDDLSNHVYLGNENDLPDVETVGGLIMTALGRPPQRGDEFTYEGGIRFVVLDIDGLAVARARVEYPVVDNDEREAPHSGALNGNP